jgi:hypothetical protein
MDKCQCRVRVPVGRKEAEIMATYGSSGPLRADFSKEDEEKGALWAPYST